MEKAITISGLTSVTAMLKDVSNFLSSTEPMQGLCDDVKDIIIEKTGDGVDYKNKRFAHYSKLYAKRKHKTSVDLRDTGEMLNSIRAEAVSPNRGKVFVGSGGRAKIAEYHNEGGTRHQTFRKGSDIMTGGILPKRRFMDINDTQLLKAQKKNYDDPLQKILGRK
jgi:hypothetical protein